MRAVGRSRAAITIVNALPTGIGAAVGIELPVTVEASVEAAGQDELAVAPATSDTALVRAAVHEAVAAASLEGRHAIRLSIASDVPVAVGLKSSSAVASAVVRAVAGAVGERPAPEDVARQSAVASRRSGVSATGAFDDALAGLRTGVVVTDNGRDVLLRAWPVGGGLAAVVWIPDGQHPSSPSLHDRFRREVAESRRAADAALAGRLWEAMQLNSTVVDRVMGYDRGELSARLRRHGAVATGTTGLGPALAAIGPRDRLGELVDELRRAPGIVRSLSFAGPSAEDGSA